MKNKTILLLAIPLMTMACNNSNHKDSVDKADSANQAKKENNPPSQMIDESSSTFLVKAADIGMAEVATGKLASAKAVDAGVKSFAEMMVNDHTGVNAQVKALAAKKNVTLPDSVSEEHKKMADDLQKKSRKDFDKAYMDDMVKGHENAVSLFQNAAQSVKDADVKAFIDNTLPKLQQHLENAKAVRSALKK